MDHQIRKWKKWVEDVIHGEVLTAYLRRQTWREIQEILESNPDLPDSYLWEFMLDTYSVTQAAAVRRQVDTSRDAASLGRLLKELANDPAKISKSFWFSLWDSNDPSTARLAEMQWNKYFAGEIGDYLDPSIPANDLKQLKDRGRSFGFTQPDMSPIQTTGAYLPIKPRPSTTWTR